MPIRYLCHRSNIGFTKVPYVSPQIFDLACELAKLPNQQFSDLFLQGRFLLGRPGGRFLLEARSDDERAIIRMLQHLIIFYKKCQYFNLDSAFMAKVTEKLRYIYDDATFFAGINRRIDEAFQYSLGNMHDMRLLLARYSDYIILGEGKSPFNSMPNDDY